MYIAHQTVAIPVKFIASLFSKSKSNNIWLILNYALVLSNNH